jgi:hypothetical protein
MYNVEGSMFENYPLYYDEVLASNDPSLTDIPQLPEIEENIEEQAFDFLSKERFGNYKEGHSDGNKTVVSMLVKFSKTALKDGKKYTEEDMLKAIQYGKTIDPDDNLLYGKEYTQFMVSLRPLPIAIEVEIEDNQCDGCNAGLPLVNGIHKDHQLMGIACTANRYTKPKVDQNNQIIIKRWIYDKV